MWTSKVNNYWKSTKDERAQLSLPISPFKAPTRGQLHEKKWRQIYRVTIHNSVKCHHAHIFLKK